MAERRAIAYSTTRKMLQVMRDKGLVDCDDTRRPQQYRARRSQAKTQLGMVDDLVHRVFEGSTQKLVMRLLSANRLRPDELAELRKLVKNAESAKR